MRVWEKLVSGVAAAVIIGGAEYAYSRERLSHADLHAWYQQINRESFDGRLQDVSVEWADLTADDSYGVTQFYDDGSISIEIDKLTNTSEAHTREVLQHEACHVATQEEATGEDKHGPLFQTCMRRFN
jgi:predicted SprT family Zn-dependent metalloprotease